MGKLSHLYPEIPMIHNLTGWDAAETDGNPILFAGRIFRIKRKAGKRAAIARLALRLGVLQRLPSHVA
jgi:hypothetical protein